MIKYYCIAMQLLLGMLDDNINILRLENPTIFILYLKYYKCIVFNYKNIQLKILFRVI